jgi:xylan 1,4-beta-xylosidase
MAKQYTNPILCGFYPDPSICRVGDDFYLISSTFAYFPGIPVFHSKDLVNWKLIGHVLDRAEQLNLQGFGVSRGIFSPSIDFHEGIFYVTCTLVDGGGNFVVTAENPAGPWSNPVWLPEINGIDPSIFFDEDGKTYIIYNGIPPDNKSLYDGHRTIRMRSFDLHQLKVSNEEIILINGGTQLSNKPRWIEGPHIIKKYGYYYLIAAEGGTGYDHSVVAFRSKLITGPYIPFENNPILTQRNLDSNRSFPVTSTGHADLVELANGSWHAVFLGCRPYEADFYNTGRETFLVPVTWENEWPLINHGQGAVMPRYPLPLPERTDIADRKYSGNFRYRADFDKPKLAPDWMFLRTPLEKWFSLQKRESFLSLRLRPQTLSGKDNPSFLARRQQHLVCQVTTALLFTPEKEGEKAGLVAFQNEDHFYFLGKALDNGQNVVQLYRSKIIPADGKSMEILETRPLKKKGIVYLHIRAMRDQYAFFFSTDNKKWEVVREGVDGKFLSTAVAGGFVGVTFGVYATSSGEPSTSEAHFDWFEYQGMDEVYR